MLPCSRSGIAAVLCATDFTVTFSPAWVKNPSFTATCSPAVSSTGSDPTTMLVPAALLVAAAGLPVACPPLAGELAPGDPAADPPPELQAAASRATERTLITLKPRLVVRRNLMELLGEEGEAR